MFKKIKGGGQVDVTLESEENVAVSFVAAKTRIAPLKKTTMLLLALLLSKLIVSIQNALQSEFSLVNPVCYTDSMVSDPRLSTGMETVRQKPC